MAQTAVEDFDRLVAVNARAPFLLMQAAASRLADGGRVVNISSGLTSTALAGIGLYSGVKAFLDQVGRSSTRSAASTARSGGADDASGARQRGMPESRRVRHHVVRDRLKRGEWPSAGPPGW